MKTEKLRCKICVRHDRQGRQFIKIMMQNLCPTQSPRETIHQDNDAKSVSDKITKGDNSSRFQQNIIFNNFSVQTVNSSLSFKRLGYIVQL